MQNPQRVIASRAQACSSSSLAAVAAQFRVMARLRDGSRALVCLASYREDAVTAAASFRDGLAVDGDHNGLSTPIARGAVAAIFTEQWIGNGMQGRWALLGPSRGGFLHVLRRSASRQPAGSKRPESGSRVACILLDAKTRKGGWRAKLADGELSGPVTNSSEMPATVAAGQIVTLRIGAVSNDGSHVQFRWLPEPSPARASRHGQAGR